MSLLRGTGKAQACAPTSAAFEKVPAEKLKELLKPENKASLAALLTYHVVPGKVMAADVKAGCRPVTKAPARTVGFYQGGISLARRESFSRLF